MSNVLEALSSRRYMISAWPWRALAYVLTTIPVAAVISTGVGMLALPWVALVTELTSGDHRPVLSVIVVLMMISAVILVTIGPLLAIPLAALERQRLGIVDLRPVTSAHRQATNGWLRTRYTEAATWRELGYLLILAFAAPFAYGCVFVLFVADLIMLFSPWAVATADGPVSIGPNHITSAADAIPYVLLGLALAPVLPYVLGVLAGGHAALARAFLGDGNATNLREVTRSRARLADAFDDERRRIERDLHDGAQHRLTSLTLQLAVARLDVADESPAALALAKAHTQAKELMVVLRDLIHGIRPQILTEMGLPASVRELAAQSAIPVTVKENLTSRLPERVENTAYFAVSEALANVAKHGHAWHADVILKLEGSTLVAEIRDDGRGGADPARGTGLTGLADRVAAINGRLLLASPEGGPTLVRVELPCQP